MGIRTARAGAFEGLSLSKPWAAPAASRFRVWGLCGGLQGLGVCLEGSSGRCMQS